MLIKKLILTTFFLFSVSGCNLMKEITEEHWEEPKDNEPHAKIIAEEEIMPMEVNGLPVNPWKHWTYDEFVLPAGKSEVVIQARNGNKHFGIGLFSLDLEDGATYFLKKEEIGENYKIFFLDAEMKEVFALITPKRFFQERFTLPVYAIPKG